MRDGDNLELEAVAHGRDAWARLKKDQTFEDWLLVGQTLGIGRSWAMRRAGTNAPAGRGYNEAFSGWLADNGFSDIDRGTRSRLADIMEHRSEIEAWRHQLPLAERLRKNHPNAIWRGWEASKRKDGLPTTADERKVVTEPRQRPGQAAEIDAATQRLHDTFDRVEQRLGPDLAGFDLSPEHIEASTNNLLDIFGEEAVRRLYGVLQRRFAPSAVSEPVDEAFAEMIERLWPTTPKLDESHTATQSHQYMTGSGLNVEVQWPPEMQRALARRERG